MSPREWRPPQPRRRNAFAASLCALALVGSAGAVGAAARTAAVDVARPVSGSPVAAAVSAPRAAARPTPDGLPLTTGAVRSALGNRRDDVAFSVRDRRTGEVFTYNPRLENQTASIVKVLILVAAIRERREDGRGLSSGQKALADKMIRYSDNDAASALMAQAGGSGAVTRLARDLRMRSTTAQGAWGRTTTTAIDQRMLVDALVDGTDVIRRADRRYVLSLMGRVTPEQRWGVGAVPKGARAELKNGWAPLSPRGWRVNSIGHVAGNGRDYTLAILSYDNPGVGTGTDLVTKVSRLVYAATGPRAGEQAVATPVAAPLAQHVGASALAPVAAEPASPSSQAAATFIPVRAGHPWIRTRGSAFPPHPCW